MSKRRYSEIENITICENVFEIYRSTMNNNTIKTDISQAIFIAKEWESKISAKFIGSYMSFPADEEEAKNLDKFYRDDKGEKAVDAIEMDKVIKILRNDISKAIRSRYRYICFVVGAVAKADEVSHHIGFIYDRTRNIIKKYDPGMRSWGPESAKIVNQVITSVIPDVPIVSAFSSKWYCTMCAGPQDICRGGYFYEASIFLRDKIGKHWSSVHRESYCQTWSILLMFNDLQQIEDSTDGEILSEAKYREWPEMTPKELEICIRNFMIWIVWKFPYDFQTSYKNHKNYNDFKNKYPNYTNLLLGCLKTFDERVQIPKPGQYAICPQISLKSII